ncbi:hypothetical protein SAY86_026919 [Trapa natans]|uniref:Uncharacterized protein n=1 Tax=Trapa natans TaxID=22666 RepID=A0AAN7QIJ0_TRANT|nr:hypothetical protein SAY86_026919 [Trapa natans]
MRGSWFNLKRRTVQRFKQFAITLARSARVNLLLLCCVGFTLVLVAILASSSIRWSDLRASDDRFSDSRYTSIFFCSLFNIYILIVISTAIAAVGSLGRHLSFESSPLT